MTCIVAMLDKKDRKIHMAGDSLATDEGMGAIILKSPKVFVKKTDHGKMLFGCCNSLRMTQILQFDFKPPKHEPKKLDAYEYMVRLFVKELRKCFQQGGFSKSSSGEESIDGSFLVGYRGRIFEIEEDYQVDERLEQWTAIGSGIDVALGSLYTSEECTDLPVKVRLEVALEAAARYNAGVRKPFVFKSIPMEG